MKALLKWEIEQGYLLDIEPFKPNEHVRHDRRAVPRARYMMQVLSTPRTRISEYIDGQGWTKEALAFERMGRSLEGLGK